MNRIRRLTLLTPFTALHHKCPEPCRGAKIPCMLRRPRGADATGRGADATCRGATLRIRRQPQRADATLVAALAALCFSSACQQTTTSPPHAASSRARFGSGAPAALPGPATRPANVDEERWRARVPGPTRRARGSTPIAAATRTSPSPTSTRSWPASARRAHRNGPRPRFGVGVGTVRRVGGR